MKSLKFKIIYSIALFLFLILGVGLGYYKESRNSLFTGNILNYAVRFNADDMENYAITTSTKVSDIEVVYEDHYLECNENETSSKIVYGTTIDKVKEDELKYQEENGLVYKVKGETNTKIIYTRDINGICHNHYLVKEDDGIITIYMVRGEDKKEVYATLKNINIENVRKELKLKIEKGTYINSREELNRFIEDLES